MHTITELNSGIPAFLAKLWKLVEDPETDDLICWSSNGTSFIIRNQAQFARELLPHYYKHNNMASFVRQLNMYGFHKKVSVELGGLKCDKDEMEFAHQYFCKGHPYLVEHIKRKIASNKSQDATHLTIKPELMNKMLSEVRSMRGRQEHLDSRLGAMKHENEALWRELALLRQKHMKQQQIVNKLIQFLVTIVQPSRGSGLPVKRRYPLMIDDSSCARQHKMSKSQASPTGPVIHELDASDFDHHSKYIVAEMLENEVPAVQSPEHTIASIDDDNMESVHLIDEDSIHLEDDIKIAKQYEIDVKKRRVCKGKKKEELHLLEMPDKVPVTFPGLNNESIGSKPVPVATLRSSKLAAMAANINKSENVEHDIDAEVSPDIEDETFDNDTSNLVKLENILIVPEIISHTQNAEDKENDDSRSNRVNQGFNLIDGGKSVLKETCDERRDDGVESGFASDVKDNFSGASTSSLKDLSLSCINSPSVSEASYREVMDSHLETMQTELDTLHEVLRGENYSTLLGLFDGDDPMTFELPINPELHPDCDKEDNDHIANVPDTTNRSASGKLMTYNSASNLLHFDDEFLNNASSSLTTPVTDLSTNILHTSDLLEDNKSSLLDSLVTNDVNSKT